MRRSAIMPEPIKLTAFIGHETTLATWDRTGVLDRELKPYLRLQEKKCENQPGDLRRARGSSVCEADAGHQDPLQPIRLARQDLPPPRSSGACVEPAALPGAEIARDDRADIGAARALGLADAANCSPEFQLVGIGARQAAGERAAGKARGRTGASGAGSSQPTSWRATQDIADALIAKDPGAAAKLTLIPNYVDDGLFRRIPTEKRYDLVFVGRMNRHKNLIALLEAVRAPRTVDRHDRRHLGARARKRGGQAILCHGQGAFRRPPGARSLAGADQE